MGIDYYYCIDCEEVFVNQDCGKKGHNYLRQYKLEYFIRDIIDLLIKNDVSGELLNLCEEVE